MRKLKNLVCVLLIGILLLKVSLALLVYTNTYKIGGEVTHVYTDEVVVTDERGYEWCIDSDTLGDNTYTQGDKVTLTLDYHNNHTVEDDTVVAIK